MLSASAVREPLWSTQADVFSDEDLALKFSDLMSLKAKAKSPGSREGSAHSSDEEFYNDLSYLSEQWRKQEVSSRIDRLKECCCSDDGCRIVARLSALRAMLKEEEGEEADIAAESLRALQLFLQAAGRVRPPGITLTPEAEIYLRWKEGRDHLFAVHLINGRMVRYTVFAPNPRHPRRIRRLSGIEAADTVLETARSIFADFDWVTE